MANIVLLQHGPKGEDCVTRTCEKLASAKDLLDKHTVSVVFQHYDTDKTYAQEALRSYQKLGYPVTLVETTDLFNPGFYNINRQAYTVSQALQHVNDDDIIIKLRNDQCIDFRKLFHKLTPLHFFESPIQKIVTTNCFTRRDRLYHPSDMFLCSSGKLLKQYYSLPIQEETHTDIVLKITEMERKGLSQRLSMIHAPESQLFVHFLKCQGWDFAYTDEDSLKAIQKYCVVLNSWDIDFCWEKKRTPGIKAGGIILPQNNFALPPFPGAPVETIACYDAQDIHGGHRHVLDILYIRLSKVLFGFFFDDLTRNIASRWVHEIQGGITPAFARLYRRAKEIIKAKIKNKGFFRSLSAAISPRRNKAASQRLGRIALRITGLLLYIPFLLIVRGRK